MRQLCALVYLFLIYLITVLDILEPFPVMSMSHYPSLLHDIPLSGVYHHHLRNGTLFMGT